MSRPRSSDQQTETETLPLKDILVHVDNSRNGEARIEYAAQLATAHDAHLSGLYVSSPAANADGGGGRSAGLPSLDFGGRSFQEYEKKASEMQALHKEHASLAADAARQKFTERVATGGVTNEWSAVEGTMMDALTHNARFCDVAVVGQPGAGSARRFGETVSDHLILSVGHPVLVVPALDECFSVGKRILIAWDRSPLATRAIHNSRPFMRNADSVHVLAINLALETHDGKPGSGIIDHLARHGIEATGLHVDDTSSSVADIILDQAKKLDIDLIIMGAYGQSRLRERILGGNTYQLLNNSPVPMLLSH